MYHASQNLTYFLTKTRGQNCPPRAGQNECSTTESVWSTKQGVESVQMSTVPSVPYCAYPENFQTEGRQQRVTQELRHRGKAQELHTSRYVCCSGMHQCWKSWKMLKATKLWEVRGDGAIIQVQCYKIFYPLLPTVVTWKKWLVTGFAYRIHALLNSNRTK